MEFLEGLRASYSMFIRFQLLAILRIQRLVLFVWTKATFRSFSSDEPSLPIQYSYNKVYEELIENIDYHISVDIGLDIFKHFVCLIIVLIVCSFLLFVISVHCLFLQFYSFSG